MAYSLSRAARADLVDIVDYTVERWGDAQAERYLDDLLRRCAEVGENPNVGKSSDDLRKGYRRIHQGRHVIYFRRVADGVEIVRVLHDRMLPENYLR